MEQLSFHKSNGCEFLSRLTESSPYPVPYADEKTALKHLFALSEHFARFFKRSEGTISPSLRFTEHATSSPLYSGKSSKGVFKNTTLLRKSNGTKRLKVL